MAIQPDRDSTIVWRKSRVSGADAGCVEVATTESSVLVRDSKDDSEALLMFSPAQWSRFVHHIKTGS